MTDIPHVTYTVQELLTSIENKLDKGFAALTNSHQAVEARVNVLEGRVSLHEAQVGHPMGLVQLTDVTKRVDVLESKTDAVTQQAAGLQELLRGADKRRDDAIVTRRWVVTTFIATVVALIVLLGFLATLFFDLSQHVTLH